MKWLVGCLAALAMFVVVQGATHAAPARAKPVVKPKAFPDPKLAKELVIAADAEVKTYVPLNVGTHKQPEFAVYVTKAYSPDVPMPLVVSSHGNGGTGKGEIGGWVKYAEQFGWIIVCPSYGLASNAPPKYAGVPGQYQLSNADELGQEEMMLAEVLERVMRSLNIDRELVLHTGFSGGGFPTCFLAMKHPEVFTALCYRSGNFCTVGLTPDPRPWINRPIYVFWGSKDNPVIIEKGALGLPDGPTCLMYYQQLGCQRLKHQLLDGGGHDPRIDLAATWFADEVVKPLLEARAKKGTKKK